MLLHRIPTPQNTSDELRKESRQLKKELQAIKQRKEEGPKPAVEEVKEGETDVCCESPRSGEADGEAGVDASGIAPTVPLRPLRDGPVSLACFPSRSLRFQRGAEPFWGLRLFIVQ
ncbi:hypothetical protein EYF80_050411 [Liparis tanakae]|uniref:Uncharacterized protein n=1 Tax=Liparis tanakae TaxID=230148 RepID=A0A4Z2FEK5_9TELE|nr:hypothetical protein EYF80_050411 [Liparis tanakae]